jgi:hypothetical protein
LRRLILSAWGTGEDGIWQALDVASALDERPRGYDFNHLAASAQAQYAIVEHERLESAKRAFGAVADERQAQIPSSRVGKPRTRDGEPTGRLDSGRLASHPAMACPEYLRLRQDYESTLRHWGQVMLPDGAPASALTLEIKLNAYEDRDRAKFKLSHPIESCPTCKSAGRRMIGGSNDR